MVSKEGSTCPIESTIQFFGQKWAMLILKNIGNQDPIRFNELLKAIPKISPRTLSKRLKELEELDFINKKAFSEIPPRVEYSLTKKGKEYQKFFNGFNKIILKWNK